MRGGSQGRCRADHRMQTVFADDYVITANIAKEPHRLSPALNQDLRPSAYIRLM